MNQEIKPIAFKLTLYLIVALFFILFSLVLPQRAFASEAMSCSAMRSYLDHTMTQLNRLTGENTVIVWNSPEMAKAKTILEGQFDKNGNILFPDLCKLKAKQPSLELTLFGILHEYSHTILDKDTDFQNTCSRTYYKTLGIDLSTDYERHRSTINTCRNHTHDNRFILALKFMNYLKVDTSKALQDMSDYPHEPASMTSFWTDQSNRLRKFENSSFIDARDFYNVGTFRETPEFQKFITTNFQDSNWVDEISKKLLNDGSGYSYFPSSLSEKKTIPLTNPRQPIETAP